MPRYTQLTAFAALSMLISLSASAHNERPDHFSGKTVTTEAQARSYFSQYNQKLAVLLASPELSPVQLLEIHEITYTLENALSKLPAESAKLADLLESLHVASEYANSSDAKKQGEQYLHAVAAMAGK